MTDEFSHFTFNDSTVLGDIQLPDAFRYHYMICELARGDITKYNEIKFSFDIPDYVIMQCYKRYENFCEQLYIKRSKKN